MMTEDKSDISNTFGLAAAATQLTGLFRQSRTLPKRTLSVRTKGLLVFSALIVYAIVIALFVLHEKRELMHEFEQIEKSFEIDRLLNRADSSAFHTVMGVFANIDSLDRDAGMERIRMHYQTLRTLHEELRTRIPMFEIKLDSVSAALEVAARDPSKDNMNQLIVELIKVKNEYSNRLERLQQARALISKQYHMQTDSVTMTALFLGMMGLALLGVCIGLFFKQLTEDLRALQSRALEIVNGYRGAPIPVRRRDEVGQLMEAVNHMATALDRREKELFLERQKYFHQEKMAAVGALAAGVAHEIGNPIAAISGIAQDMVERRSESTNFCGGKEGCSQCRPDMILEQAQRLSAITREISDFASPQPVDPQFVDLNGQLRSTSSLIRYDKRMRRVNLRLDLDSQLPAIYAVADQLTQLIMNLMINAMDALEPMMDRSPTISISTRVEGERICMTVEDNGPGMEKDVLERAFDAFFTTKPAGKGTGLGLPLCYSIMERHEGAIEIDSTPGAGTRIQVFFPIKEIS